MLSPVTENLCLIYSHRLVPIGGVVMALVALLLQLPEQKAGTRLSLKQKIEQANMLGSICLVPGIVCLCLALQWGGTTYSVSFPWVLLLSTFNFFSGGSHDDFSGTTDGLSPCSSSPFCSYSHSASCRFACRRRLFCLLASFSNAAFSRDFGQAVAQAHTRLFCVCF